MTTFVTYVLLPLFLVEIGFIGGFCFEALKQKRV